jgi:KDO2-lipid IV(A) lauroyltransferase
MKKFVFFLLEIFSKLLSLLPRKAVRAIGSFLGFLWVDVLRVRRKVIKQNLDIAFPEMPDKEKMKIGRTSVYNLGANFLEVFTVPSFDDKWLSENVVFEGYENLEKAKAMNKGVYVLSMHMGNGDSIASSLTMRGNSLYLISKSFKNPFVNDLWFHFRGAKGVKYIEAHGEKTAFEILRAIKSKSLVVFVLDQFMGKPFGILTTFFGRKTGTAYGLALFYIKTRSPVVPIYGYEGRDGKLHVVAEEPLELETFVSSDQDMSIRQLTQKFCDVIEGAVKKHPSDWMWVHRRWKDYE